MFIVVFSSTNKFPDTNSKLVMKRLSKLKKIYKTRVLIRISDEGTQFNALTLYLCQILGIEVQIVPIDYKQFKGSAKFIHDRHILLDFPQARKLFLFYHRFSRELNNIEDIAKENYIQVSKFGLAKVYENHW